MNRDQLSEKFYIEEHAVLFALLVKYAKELQADAGLNAAEAATKIYGKERGLRMAMRAAADGEELSPYNYIVYGEWADPRGMQTNVPVQLAPEYHMDVVRCGWNDSWRKYDLLEYGAIYCKWIDKYLVKGFNPENTLGIDTFLSCDGPRCNFQWTGVCLNSEDELKQCFIAREERLDRVVKDFLYHCGHLLWCMRRVYCLELGYAAGRDIIDKALDHFRGIYGEEMTQALVEESHQDFLNV